MNWLINNTEQIVNYFIAHLLISIPAIVISLILSIPIGWLAAKKKMGFLVSITSLLYAVPSLPLLIIIPVILGTSVRSVINVIVALVIYGIALLVRSITDGLNQVPEEIRLSATAQGYSAWQLFYNVELPLAGPVILSGLRVVSVAVIALTTVSGVLGIPNLGMLFTDGFQRGLIAEVVTGLILTGVLSIILDRLLVVCGNILMPWSVQ